jgi:hypothetical protein
MTPVSQMRFACDERKMKALAQQVVENDALRFQRSNARLLRFCFESRGEDGEGPDHGLSDAGLTFNRCGIVDLGYATSSVSVCIQ